MPNNPSRLSQDLEELLEHLYLCQEERHTAVVPAALPPEVDQHSIEEAVQKGLAAKNGAEELRLTPEGIAIGRDVVRRHRLAECLLRDVLGVPIENINEDACRIEHIIQHGLDEKTCILLGHPRQCPHGHAIPAGACCARAQAEDLREVKPLCEGKPEESGVVAYLNARDNQEIRKLMAMGILPGAKIQLLQRYPSYVFQMGFSQFTIDRELAEKIYIHWHRKHEPPNACRPPTQP